MSAELNRFLDAMEQKNGYRPELWPNVRLMNERDADRYEGWKLARSGPELMKMLEGKDGR